MTRKELTLAAALAVALVATTVAVPAMVDARPAYAVPVHEGGEDASFASPGSEDWDAAPAATLHMSSAESGLPNASSTSVEHRRGYLSVAIPGHAPVLPPPGRTGNFFPVFTCHKVLTVLEVCLHPTALPPTHGPRIGPSPPRAN